MARLSHLPLAATLAALLAPWSSARAHDYWTTDQPVPAWVKVICCGKADAHQLNPAAVHVRADGYHIDGLDTVVPMSRVLPSQDGQFWGFWSASAEPKPVIFCFFAPISGA